MKVLIEEIVRPDGYERLPINREAYDMPDSLELSTGDPLWFEPADHRNDGSQRQLLVIMAVRTCIIDDSDDIGLLVDVAADYIRDEISVATQGEVNRKSPVYQTRYIEWAIENKVWP